MSSTAIEPRFAILESSSPTLFVSSVFGGESGFGGRGGGGGGGSEGEGDDGGVDGGSARATVVVGTSSTVNPSAVEAALAVPRVEESEVCTSSAVMEAGTAMVAVTRTLAAATRIVTSDLSTPAASATFLLQA